MGANLRRPFWTAVAVTFLLLVNETSESISIGLKMYLLLTENSARGAVRFSDRLGTAILRQKVDEVLDVGSLNIALFVPPMLKRDYFGHP